MEIATSFFVAIGLAMDAFAVSLGVATGGRAKDFRAKFRLAFHFGFFQFLMTVVGWLLGSTVAAFIDGIDHWVALVMLSYVGINMLRSGLSVDKESYPTDPSRGKMLLMLCVATSLDALAVGISMAMIRANVWIPSAIIGIVCLILSTVGLMTGSKLGEKFGKRMEIIGGLILIGIGIRVLITHIG